MDALVAGLVIPALLPVVIAKELRIALMKGEKVTWIIKKDQEVFNEVCKHLFVQKKQCFDQLGSGLYHKGEMSCAIGCLFDRETADRIMDGAYIDRLSASDLIREYPDFEEFIGDNEKLVDDLQDLHDGKKPEYWETGLRSIAEKYKLSTDSITKHCRKQVVN